ncbi:alpha/beta hydrolase [Streptosporangium nondiastaticum]|uniref:alpha/beta fold hydrolase n=1 Tax=Streptosporangium nondiastaticum TaxID=35764 RepID=UPI0031F9A145
MLPVVLVHGIRVSATMWDPVAARIGGPVAAPDLPGHGSRRGEPFTMEGAASAVADAIDALGGRAFVAGLSLGGYVGIAAAGRFPERVAGLAALGCTSNSRLTTVPYRFAASLAARNPARADQVSARLLRGLLPGPAGAAMVAGGLACEVLPQVVEAVTGYDHLAALAAYPGRVWLVNGTRDPLRTNERDFLRACRNGRLILLPRRGHLGALAAPGPLARLLEDLRDLSYDRPDGDAGAPVPAGVPAGTAGDRPDGAIGEP